ncbi:hypothetical protein SODG_003215 [Sodalis praecaptivus]
MFKAHPVAPILLVEIPGADLDPRPQVIQIGMACIRRPQSAVNFRPLAQRIVMGYRAKLLTFSWVTPCSAMG